MIAVLIVLAGAIGALVAFAVHGGFRRASSGSHAGPRHHGHSEGWTDDAPADDYEPCPDCGGGPSDLHDDCAPDLTIRPFDGELTAERMERIRRGLREALRQAEPPDEFLAAPAPSLVIRRDGGELTEEEAERVRERFLEALRRPAEPWIGVPVGDILVEPTLPPLPSFTPVWEPRPCRDVAEASVWTPPADPDLREFVDARMAGPSRSALGSWVDDVLAGPGGLGYLQPFWRDGGWTA